MQMHIVRMTLREKCAQKVFIGFRFDDPDYDRAMRLVKAVGIGGVCVFGGSVFDVTPFLNSLQRVAKFPLLACSDFEDGAGQQILGATVYPSNMAIGAAGSEELAYLKGRHTGLEGRVMGVPWTLAPVADINVDPLNPVINTRAFGEDPDAAAKLARAAVRGLHAAGALACAKHFPGHGAVRTDSHLELPALDVPLEQLVERELKPYAALASEVDAVMVGHLLARAVDPNVPASLSREVIEGLLRGRLGFDGLVCTDTLVMGGIAKFCGEKEAVERAAVAGADVILMPGDPELAVGVLEEAVKAGRLSEKAVDRSVERIFALKERAGLFSQRIVDMGDVERVVGNDAHRAGARRVAEAAVTLVRGSGRVEGSAACLRLAAEGTRGDAAVFERELGQRVKIDAASSTCVVAVFFRPRAYRGSAGLDPALVERLREARRKHKELIVVSFGSPYILREFPEADGFICAYGEDEHCQRAAARALAGEIPYKGRLPVRLEG